MKNLIAAALVSLLLLLLGCGSTLHQGQIIERWYEPPHIEQSTTFIKTGNVLVPITSYRHIGPHWYIRIETTDDKGKTHHRTVRVSQSDYQSDKLGDGWSDGK